MTLASTRLAVISRAKGHSSVASAAYRSGEKIKEEHTGEIHDYRRKQGVIYAAILTPANAPEWMHDRGALWNAVEQGEKRKDAQLARSLYFALPRELTHEQNIQLTRAIAQQFTHHGMVVDVAIHDHQDGNPHAHLLLTTRAIEHDHFGRKNREWNNRENATLWREQIATLTNQTLERYVSVHGMDRGLLQKPLAEGGPNRSLWSHV